MTNQQKIQSIKIIHPNAKNIKLLSNGLFDCIIDGKHYEIEVYQSWDTIHVQGVRELADRDKCKSSCQSYENYILKSKRRAGL